MYLRSFSLHCNTREYSANSNAAVQVYYDFARRFIHLGKEQRHTIDLDIQHRFPLAKLHDVVWGVGYRLITDDISTRDELFRIKNNNRTDVLYRGFMQDEMGFFDDRFRVILGSKFEYNSYSGFEIQPNARMFFEQHPNHKFWAAVSRAVRTPSRIEDGIRFRLDSFLDPDSGLPIEIILTGNYDFDPEDLIAYEVGYRLQPIDWVFIDITAFFNYYDNLLTFEPGEPSVILGETPKVVQPVFYDNKADGKIYGFEVASTWKPFDFWKLQVNYTLLKMDIEGDGDSNDPTAEIAEDRVVKQPFTVNYDLIL